MPATRTKVTDALRAVMDPREVFLLVNQGDEIFWSEAGSGSDVEKARFHAESKFLDWFAGYDLEEGEIIELTIKWSPCPNCAHRLAEASQKMRAKGASLEVYYLDRFRGASRGLLSSLDPLEILDVNLVKHAPYERTADGAWWPAAKRSWESAMG
jgi:hypothetical protein